MKNLKLNDVGVEEMSATEMSKIEGGLSISVELDKLITYFDKFDLDITQAVDIDL